MASVAIIFLALAVFIGPIIYGRLTPAGASRLSRPELFWLVLIIIIAAADAIRLRFETHQEEQATEAAATDRRELLSAAEADQKVNAELQAHMVLESLRANFFKEQFYDLTVDQTSMADDVSDLSQEFKQFLQDAAIQSRLSNEQYQALLDKFDTMKIEFNTAVRYREALLREYAGATIAQMEHRAALQEQELNKVRDQNNSLKAANSQLSVITLARTMPPPYTSKSDRQVIINGDNNSATDGIAVASTLTDSIKDEVSNLLTTSNGPTTADSINQLVQDKIANSTPAPLRPLFVPGGNYVGPPLGASASVSSIVSRGNIPNAASYGVGNVNTLIESQTVGLYRGNQIGQTILQGTGRYNSEVGTSLLSPSFESPLNSLGYQANQSPLTSGTVRGGVAPGIATSQNNEASSSNSAPQN